MEKYITKEPNAKKTFQEIQAKFIEIKNFARSAQYSFMVFMEQRQTEIKQNKKYIIQIDIIVVTASTKVVSVRRFKIWLACNSAWLAERIFISVKEIAVKERLPRTYKTQNAFHSGWLPLMKLIFGRVDEDGDASML